MNVESHDLDTVTLSPKMLVMKQPLDMNLFHITHYDLIKKDNLQDEITMVIVMKRKIMSEMMTTFFPSMLLMLITFATTFFKPFFFEAALSVNLTTMLVMTTIFISKMEGLPPTSDIKMIDIWLILCQLVPFAQVVLLTAIEYLREEEQEVEKQDKETQVSKGREIVPDEKGVELNAIKEPKAHEAWVPMNAETGKEDVMNRLLTIGKSFLRYSSYI